MLTPQGEKKLDSGMFYMVPAGGWHHWRNDGIHVAATIGLLIDAEHPGRWPRESGVMECCRELRRLVRGFQRFNVAGDLALAHSFWELADRVTSEQPRNLAATTGLLWVLMGQIVERLADDSPVTAISNEDALRIRQVLVARLNEQPSLAEIASEAGLSPTVAKQVFRATYGHGIMHYFNQLKIWQAQRLLSSTSLTVEQVSRKLGFTSATYFSRVFFRYTGRTPVAFRKHSD
jgi:AraC-like DNA-binding protein